MRVPTYQQQVSYQAPTARTVQLAVPTLESSRSKRLTDLETAGQVLQGAVDVKNAIEEQFAGKASGKESVPMQSKAAQTDEAVFLSENFSSPARQQLLAFSRDQAFETNPAAPDVPSDAVGKLDDFFGQQARQLALHPEQADQSLLAQDYAAIRREVADVQARQQQAARQEQFNQGAGSFVQTAALISSPSVLEQYMQANLAAAQTEAQANGLTAIQWQQQKQLLQKQALQHNMETSLTNGEPAQAQAVLNHFQAQFSEEEKSLLQGKITACTADHLARQLSASAYEKCRDEKGEINPTALQQFAQEAAQTHQADSQPLYAALQMQVAAQRRADLKQQADMFGQLLQDKAADDFSGAQVLIRQNFTSEKEFAHTQKVWQEMQAAPQPADTAAAFNELYQKLETGRLARAELDAAQEQHKISARDYLHLQQQYCLRQAGQWDLRDNLLDISVDKLCRSYNLSDAEMQQAKYFIFSAGADMQTRLHAAQELKRLLTLQENKK